jgi:hypothetical protein
LETDTVALELDMDTAALKLETDSCSWFRDEDRRVSRNIKVGELFGWLALVNAEAVLMGQHQYKSISTGPF